MSREVQFNDLLRDSLEVSASPKPVLNAVATTLRPFLDNELARLKREKRFLENVYESMTGSADVEGATTIAVDAFLSGTLRDLGFGR